MGNITKIIPIILAKGLYQFSRFFKLGSGFTWPGHLLLTLYPRFIGESLVKLAGGFIAVSGTNGKTTTVQALAWVLRQKGRPVITNPSGANLPNGVASALLAHAGELGSPPPTIGVFEVDEAALPEILRLACPQRVLLLNLFRDQLDRYGEIDTLLGCWRKALRQLPPGTTVFVNVNDPALCFLVEGLSLPIVKLGLRSQTQPSSTVPHHADSLFCFHCGQPLAYESLFYSHLGVWSCPRCHWRMPRPDLVADDVRLEKAYLEFRVGETTFRSHLGGVYNVYNLLAVIAVARHLGIGDEVTAAALGSFSAQFGRQEGFSVEGGAAVKILLSKNPTGFSENLNLLSGWLTPVDRLLLVLNDGLADGRDVSWIYDVDFEPDAEIFRRPVFVSGDRALDLALRLKYAGVAEGKLFVEADLERAVRAALRGLPQGGTLYALPTYTAMLRLRRILLGRAIG